MTIVLDTNVLVSGILSGLGAPAQIVDLVVAGRLTAAFDSRVMDEYREVLRRPKFRLKPSRVEIVLEAVESGGW